MNLDAAQRCMDGDIIIMGSGVEPEARLCDGCGREISGPPLPRAGDDLFLCPDCRAWRREWNGGTLEGVLHNYLIGNVM